MTKFAEVKYDLENKSAPSVSIPLPGGNGQFKHLLEQDISTGKNSLIIGPISNSIVIKLLVHFSELSIIADNYDSMISIRMNLKENDSFKIKMMDFAHTDFEDKHFDLIYSQRSISVSNRKDIIKEMKRIITDDGLLSVGEIVSLKEPVPVFVKDIWERSGIEALSLSGINQYYENRGFKIISEKDLSTRLRDFYESVVVTVSKADKDQKEADKKYYSQLKHESNVYLKLGGDKFIGFKSLIMRKSN